MRKRQTRACARNGDQERQRGAVSTGTSKAHEASANDALAYAHAGTEPTTAAACSGWIGSNPRLVSIFAGNPGWGCEFRRCVLIEPVCFRAGVSCRLLGPRPSSPALLY